MDTNEIVATFTDNETPSFSKPILTNNDNISYAIQSTETTLDEEVPQFETLKQIPVFLNCDATPLYEGVPGTRQEKEQPKILA